VEFVEFEGGSTVYAGGAVTLMSSTSESESESGSDSKMIVFGVVLSVFCFSSSESQVYKGK